MRQETKAGASERKPKYDPEAKQMAKTSRMEATDA
jgi:hypothetical protein